MSAEIENKNRVDSVYNEEILSIRKDMVLKVVRKTRI